MLSGDPRAKSFISFPPILHNADWTLQLRLMQIIQGGTICGLFSQDLLMLDLWPRCSAAFQAVMWVANFGEMLNAAASKKRQKS